MKSGVCVLRVLRALARFDVTTPDVIRDAFGGSESAYQMIRRQLLRAAARGLVERDGRNYRITDEGRREIARLERTAV